jgi:hypothetical protein
MRAACRDRHFDKTACSTFSILYHDGISTWSFTQFHAGLCNRIVANNSVQYFLDLALFIGIVRLPGRNDEWFKSVD